MIHFRVWQREGETPSQVYSSIKLLVERCGCRWLGSICGEYDLYVCDSFLRFIVQNSNMDVIRPDSCSTDFR